MAGETHLVVGVASVLTLTQPKSVREAVLAVGVGAVGSLISDIDVGSSESRKGADKIIGMLGAVVILIFLLDHYFHAGVWDKIISNRGVTEILIGALLFIGTCVFGMEQPHRSFMHSILALVILEIALTIMMPSANLYFAIGFISHLAIDLLNRKKVMLLYPMKKGWCFKLCHANGIVNRVLLYLGAFAAVGEMWVIFKSFIR